MRAGRLLYDRGTAPATLQFVLDGHVEIAAESGPPDTKTAPAPLAFEEILEGHPMRNSVRALEPTISLSIGTEAFLSLLAENVELAEGMMRWIIESRAELGSEVLIPGQLSAEVQRKAAGGLQAIDRVLLLQGSPLLKAASGTQLLRFAAFARPVTLKAGGDPLANVTEPSMLVVLTGTITVTRPDGSRHDQPIPATRLGCTRHSAASRSERRSQPTARVPRSASHAPMCSTSSPTKPRSSSRCLRDCLEPPSAAPRNPSPRRKEPRNSILRNLRASVVSLVTGAA